MWFLFGFCRVCLIRNSAVSITSIGIVCVGIKCVSIMGDGVIVGSFIHLRTTRLVIPPDRADENSLPGLSELQPKFRGELSLLEVNKSRLLNTIFVVANSACGPKLLFRRRLEVLWSSQTTPLE